MNQDSFAFMSYSVSVKIIMYYTKILLVRETKQNEIIEPNTNKLVRFNCKFKANLFFVANTPTPDQV